jgi:hypothetical protein
MYTPKPWYTKPNSSGGVLVIRGEQTTQIIPSEDGVLMAAAPDLLEACKAIIAFAKSNPWTGLADADDKTLLRDLKAAINKAEGRKP